MRIPNLPACVLAALGALAVSPVSAQTVVDEKSTGASPDGRFGIGFDNHGGHIQYAFTEAFHIGLTVTLEYYREEFLSDDFSRFAPYAKYLFSGDVLKPYVSASLRLTKPYDYPAPGPGASRFIHPIPPQSELRLLLSSGAEHFLNQNVGVYGHVDLIDSKLEPAPSTAEFGLLGGTAGLEFFF
jgi:hypothetical protein